MDNPYKSPDSALIENDGPMDYKSLRWKILFFILLPLELWSQYDTFTVNEDNETFLWRVLSLVLYLIFYVSLYGLAFKKVILNSKFWLYYLPVYVALDVYEIAKMFINIPKEDHTFVLIVFAVIMPLMLITYYSVYKYAMILKKLPQ